MLSGITRNSGAAAGAAAARGYVLRGHVFSRRILCNCGRQNAKPWQKDRNFNRRPTTY
jgi:hypothetical protein